MSFLQLWVPYWYVGNSKSETVTITVSREFESTTCMIIDVSWSGMIAMGHCASCFSLPVMIYTPASLDLVKVAPSDHK